MFAAISDPADYLVHDVLFHRIISQASGNPILAALMETITTAMYDKRLKTVERSIDMRESAEMHREIYRSVRARDPLEARRLMEQHLRMAQVSQDLERSPVRKTAQGATRPKRVQAELKATPLENNLPATAG